jgi:hypothetical protein
MDYFEGLLAIWLPLAVLPFLFAIAAGMWKLSRRDPSFSTRSVPTMPIDVVIPMKGSFPDQESILSCMLEQNYPDYRVIFALERDTDAGVPVVDRLSRKYPHASKVIAGASETCAQKNHNLVAGLRAVRPEAGILVFCDSTNVADAGWLERFTTTVRLGQAEVVTTFRAFRPEPETLGGVCQAIYGTFLLLLAKCMPRPWGGATAILRQTFERLDVANKWEQTVVDDLVLGNALEQAGVAIEMDQGAVLTSPLKNQTVRGFLSYLDRQILFPKFTNPGIWLTTLLVYLNLSLAFVVSVCVAVSFLAGRVGLFAGLPACGFLVSMLCVAVVLRRVNPFGISLPKWLAYFVPAMGFHAYIIVRSVFRNYIDWHGRRYWPGTDGVVLRVGVADNGPLGSIYTAPSSGNANKRNPGVLENQKSGIDMAPKVSK